MLSLLFSLLFPFVKPRPMQTRHLVYSDSYSDSFPEPPQLSQFSKYFVPIINYPTQGFAACDGVVVNCTTLNIACGNVSNLINDSGCFSACSKSGCCGGEIVAAPKFSPVAYHLFPQYQASQRMPIAAIPKPNIMPSRSCCDK